jgi:MFS family permease
MQGSFAARSGYSIITQEFTMKDLLRDSIYRLNLFVMILSWIASSFCFFIIGFYIKYIPGDIFSNMIACSIADGASSIVAGMMAQYYGTKTTLSFSFACAALGAVLLTQSTSDPTQITICIMTTKFGINCAFTLCYIISAEYFPSIVCSRVFGICNIFARVATIMSPMISELDPPIPMMIYVLFCSVTMVASRFLTKNEEAEEAMRELDESISNRDSFLSVFASV